MVIVGDLAVPTRNHARALCDSLRKVQLFNNQLVFCNFEGLLTSDSDIGDEKLFNVDEALEVFCPEQTVLSLANNHTYDYPQSILSTRDALEEKGYRTVGLMHGQCFEPCVARSGNSTYALFGHCWEVYTRTNPNCLNDVRVVDCDYGLFFNEVARYIKEHPEHRVVCYFHWNYDLEWIPFPMHRRLAKDLIDAGAFAVVGGHSHVPQGGEMYKGRPIVYGFGNFYIPSNEYFGGGLVYPDCSKTTMALEIDDETGASKCHWFKTDCESSLELISSEDFKTGETITSYSPFRNLEEAEYKQFFKKNRRKRFLVPVFDEYQGIASRLKQHLAVLRIRTIKRIKG